MSKRYADVDRSTADEDQPLLRSYPVPLKGQLVFACKKCQRKSSRPPNLKKELKRLCKHEEERTPLRVVQLTCIKMCPKDGIAVCTQRQLGRSLCSIVRTKEDVALLYAQCVAEGSEERTVPVRA